VVLEISDTFCEWNAGRYRVSPTGAARTDEEADLRLDAGALAAVYLGEFTFNRLARAQRVEELKEGALRRADRLFHSTRAPCCPENF
jgi:predicted acetyltransferase